MTTSERSSDDASHADNNSKSTLNNHSPTVPLHSFRDARLRPHEFELESLKSTEFSLLSSLNSASPILPKPSSSLSFLSSFGLSKRRTIKQEGSEEKQRLNELGYVQELKRDYDFLSSLGVGLANVGFVPGTYLGVLTASEIGGSSMYCIGWPILGIFVCTLVAILAEMASTYPVAGAMFTWSYRLCRSSPILNKYARYISWLVGSMLLAAHLLTQVCTSKFVKNDAHIVTGRTRLSTRAHGSGYSFFPSRVSRNILEYDGHLLGSPRHYRLLGFLPAQSFAVSMEARRWIHHSLIRDHQHHPAHAGGAHQVRINSISIT